MGSQLQPVRGTQSLYGSEADRLHRVIAAFNKVRRLYRFRRVEIPVFEATEVFARSIGETTDIVSKEMYTFFDKGNERITLRPEFTAGIARAYLSEGWQQHLPMKVATWGPAFRYERPQRGRFRQFHQIDAEVIGAAEPAADVELIAFAAQLLEELRVGDQVRLQLNTLGDAESRKSWRSALVDHFTSHADELSDDCRTRLLTNPLRILDSKDPRDKVVATTAPIIDNFLTREAREFYYEVESGLRSAGITFTRNPQLVRGLDYYRHTAFEFVTTNLGAQGTVIGGGRYDGLIETMGGPPTPAVGWAGGIERMAMLLSPRPNMREIMAVVPENERAEGLAQRIAFELRRKGVPVDYLYRGSARKRLERYQKRGLTTAIFVDAPVGDSSVAGTINIKRYRRMSHSSESRIARNLSTLFDVISAYDVGSEETVEGRRFDFVLRYKRPQ